jgi:hypothetical protein
MTRLILLIGLFLLHMSSDAQPFSSQKLPPQQVKPLGINDPLSAAPDWRPQMRSLRAPEKEAHEAFHEQKAAAQRAYQEAITSGPSPTPQRTAASLSPSFFKGYFTNTRDTGFPNDNSLAVNQDGSRIVSVVNLDISAYDGRGNELFSKSLEAFTPGTGTNQKYDPRVLYDPLRDRFVFTCLNGFEPAKSRVILAFSSTSRPEDPWHVYELDGNFELINQRDVWSDYPQCGLSEEELFVCVNLFSENASSPNSRAQGAGVWQIDLDSAYAGGTLQVQPHSLQGTFSLYPVQGGSGLYGPEFYFVDNNSSGSDNNIFVWKMTNTAENFGFFETPATFNASESYRLAPNAAQKGDTSVLLTLDSRIRHAYREGDYLVFAFHAQGKNRRSAIFLGQIKLSPIVLSFSQLEDQLIESEVFDYAYPSVAYGGCSSAAGRPSTFLFANVSSPNHYPGNAALHIDTTGEVSEPLLCIEGEAPLQRNMLPRLRWGDYTGISTPNPGEVWVAGYTTNAEGRNQTFVSQLFNGGCVAVPQPPSFDENRIVAYPNPATGEEISFLFELAEAGNYRARILDHLGRRIHVLVDAPLEAGEAWVSFNTSPLNNGVYHLVLEKEGGQVAHRKFVVAR